MKRLLILTIFAVCSLCWAQEQQVDVFEYAVPLPATSGVSYLQWHYQLELAFEDGEPGTLHVFQYDRRGRLYGEPKEVVLGQNEVLLWDSQADLENSRVRSIALRADRPLMGNVIAEHLGQLMANSLVVNQASQVAIPFIPELTQAEFYDQLTLSLSVFGAAPNGAAADVDFTLIDNRGITQASQRLRDGLTSNGALPVTPYFSLVLDGLESQVTPAWARISSESPDYALTAIQAYALTLDAASVTETAAATESENDPVTQGQLVFTDNNRNDEGWVVLTNPHPHDVAVDLKLFYTPDFTAEQQSFIALLNHNGPIVFNAPQSLVLRPLERRLVRLGDQLFGGIEGIWHRIGYTSYRVVDAPVLADQEPAPAQAAGIFAMSFFTDGASQFTASLFSEMGNTLDLWIRLDALQEKQLELVTTGEQFWVPNVNAGDANEATLSQRLDPAEMFATSNPNGDLVSETTAVTIEIFSGEKLLNRSETVLNPGERFTGINTSNIRELFEKSGALALRIRVTGHAGAPLTADEVILGETDRATLKPHISTREIPEDFLGNGEFGGEPASAQVFKN